MNTSSMLPLDDIHIHEECEWSNVVNDEGSDNIEPPIPTIACALKV